MHIFRDFLIDRFPDSNPMGDTMDKQFFLVKSALLRLLENHSK